MGVSTLQSMQTHSHFTFNNLIGQERAKDLLRRSIANNRVGHAYLFRGPDGVGKKRTALTLAAYINCQAPDADDLCGRCRSCRKLQSGNHPDLQVIQPDGAMIKINQIRQLKRTLAFPPLEAKYRVVIVEDVQTMRREAANSLLKTLEEPPPDNLLILTVDQSSELLPTIVSRCQIIPFSPLPYEQMAQTLMHEDRLDRETAMTLAAISEGSLGQAKILQDNRLLDCRRLIVEKVLSLLPHQPEVPAAVFLLAEKAANLKEQLPDLFDLLRIWLRDLLSLAAGGSESLIISRDLTATMAAARERWSLEELSDKLRLINQAEKKLQRNCNRALVCEVLFFSLI
jgi:DNA polymerase-3 subunit delta'